MTFLPRLCAALIASTTLACTGEADWTFAEHGAPTAAAIPGTTQVGTWALKKDGLPAGAQIRSMAWHDGAAFIVADALGHSEIYALPRGASQWTAVSPERRTAGEQFGHLALGDRALYVTSADDAAGTGGLYVLRFSDDPWTRVETAPALPLSAITRKSGRLLVAAHGASDTAGLYSSWDEGKTWVRLTGATDGAAFFTRPVRTFAASAAAQRLFATGEPTSGFGGLYSSDDGGITWTKQPVRGDVVDIRASAEFVLASTTLEGELRSDNYGSTFHPFSTGSKIRTFHLSGARAFAATEGGVLVSDDGGLTWRDASAGLPSFTRVDCLYAGGGALMAASGADLFVAEVK